MHTPTVPAASSSSSPSLEPGERILLAALEAWASDRPSPNVKTLAKSLAWRTSDRVAAVFVAWIHAIEAARLRPLEATCRVCGGSSQDLQRLVVACGIAPVDLRLGERLIEPLVSEAGSVMVLARLLNSALAEAGWPLPARLGRQPADPQDLTLH
jgi:hypothetical protein